MFSNYNRWIAQQTLDELEAFLVSEERLRQERATRKIEGNSDFEDLVSFKIYL